MVRRPLSVWVVLILLGIIAICLIYFLAGFVYFYAIGRSLVHSMLYFALGVLLRILLAVVATWTLVGVAQRMNWGRIAGLGLIASTYLFWIYINMKHPVHYANAAQRGGADILDILIFAFYTVLFYKFGFGRKSRLYFAPPH